MKKFSTSGTLEITAGSVIGLTGRQAIDRAHVLAVTQEPAGDRPGEYRALSTFQIKRGEIVWLPDSALDKRTACVLIPVEHAPPSRAMRGAK